jgi:hypothetical protein
MGTVRGVSRRRRQSLRTDRTDPVVLDEVAHQLLRQDRRLVGVEGEGGWPLYLQRFAEIAGS